MLHALSEIAGYRIVAEEGVLGELREVWLDPSRWVLSHLVVDTGQWAQGRGVLLPLQALRQIDREGRRIEVALTRQQLEAAPVVERPPSPLRESGAAVHPHYAESAGLWGALDLPPGTGLGPFAPEPAAMPPDQRPEPDTAGAAPPMHSVQLIGHGVVAQDGSLGHIDDLMVESGSWQLPLLVVDLHNWLPDRLVLVPSSQVSAVDRAARQLVLRCGRQQLRDSPPYERGSPPGEEQRVATERFFEKSV